MGVNVSKEGDTVARAAEYKLDKIIQLYTLKGEKEKIKRNVPICQFNYDKDYRSEFYQMAGHAQRKINRTNKKFNVEINPYFEIEDGKEVVIYRMDVYYVD